MGRTYHRGQAGLLHANQAGASSGVSNALRRKIVIAGGSGRIAAMRRRAFEYEGVATIVLSRSKPFAALYFERRAGGVMGRRDPR